MPYDPNLIVTLDNRNDVIASLIAGGHPMAALVIASNVDLANMYHAGAPRPSDIQQATSAAIMATLAAMHAAPPVPLPTYPTHYRTEMVIRIAGLGDDIMLVGPAGCGKTTIGEHTADALGLPFYITNAINDTHELMGFVDGYGRYHTTPFRTAFEQGGIWIADEIDAWDASVLLAANSALANGFASFPDLSGIVRRHADFRMVATANTFGSGADRIYIGRNELDAASLDRFAILTVDYDLELERLFAAGRDEWLERVWSVRKAVTEKKIRHVVSSRAIAKGARALNAGISRDDVEEFYLWKGLKKADRDKIA